MRSGFAFAVTCAGSLLFGTTLFAQYTTLMEDGQQSDLRGKTIKAANKYAQAATVAKTSDERVQALLSYAQAYRGARSNAQLNADEAAKIGQALKTALGEASGTLAFRSHNDYGVFLLERGDATGAVTVFEDGQKDFGGVAAPTASRYLYNLALAEQKAEQPQQAMAAYRQALERDPSFANASDAALTTASSLDAAAGAREAIDLIRFLIDKKQVAQAREALARFFDAEQWVHQPVAEEVSSLFVRWTIEGDQSYDAIAKQFAPRLERIARQPLGLSSHKIEQLLHVFDRDVPPDFDVNTAERWFGDWLEDSQRSNLAKLAVTSADSAQLDEWQKACGMYIAAWRLDQANESVLPAIAKLLQSNASTDEGRGLLHQFIEHLYLEKTLALVRHDSQTSLRLHVILGSIAASENKWGPPDSPGTATFHYEQALHAYDAIRQADPNTSAYPGIHADLAAAYVHIGRKDEAWEQYVEAADENLATGNRAAADVMIGGAMLLGYQPTSEQAARLKRVTEDLAKGAPLEAIVVTDGQLVEIVQQRVSAIPGIRDSKIGVTSKGGVVTVTGNIPEEAQPYVLDAIKRAGSAVKEIRLAGAAH